MENPMVAGDYYEDRYAARADSGDREDAAWDAYRNSQQYDEDRARRAQSTEAESNAGDSARTGE